VVTEDKKQRLKRFIQKDKGNQVIKETAAVSLLSRRELYIPLLLAFLATYAHFWGYGYLKGKLEIIGFKELEVDMTLLESIYQATRSLPRAMQHLIDLGWLKIVVIVLAIFAYIFVLAALASFTKLSKQQLAKKRKQKIEKDPNLAQSIVKEALRITSKSVSKSFDVLCSFSLAILLLLLLLLVPQALGNLDAEKYVKDTICKPIDFENETQKRIKACTQLTPKGQDPISGRILFKNKELTVFVTGDVSYLLDYNNKVIATTRFYSNPNKQAGSPEQESKS